MGTKSFAICDAGIFASKIICGENVQSLEDKQMEFATSFDHNTDDLKLILMCFKMLGKTVQNVQETSETEDQNVQVSADQNVQENDPNAEATQSKKN
jgi:hypothetical protein